MSGAAARSASAHRSMIEAFDFSRSSMSDSCWPSDLIYLCPQESCSLSSGACDSMSTLKRRTHNQMPINPDPHKGEHNPHNRRHPVLRYLNVCYIFAGKHSRTPAGSGPYVVGTAQPSVRPARFAHADRSAHAHQSASSGVEHAGRYPGLPLLHRAGPLGRHAARARSKSRASTRKRRSAGSSRTSARSENTIQYSWLIEMAQRFFGFHGRPAHADNWEELYDDAASEDGAARLGRARCWQPASSKRCF